MLVVVVSMIVVVADVFALVFLLFLRFGCIWCSCYCSRSCVVVRGGGVMLGFSFCSSLLFMLLF